MDVKNRHFTSRWSEEKISSAVLIVLVTMSVVVFALFFTVGYNEPWEENTEFLNPAYTDSLINFMFFMGGTALLTTVVSLIWNARCHGHILNVTGGVPAGKIAACVIILLVATLAVSFITASDNAMIINGKSYTEASWLLVSDMLIHSIETLFVVAIIAVVYGMSGINRRIHKH